MVELVLVWAAMTFGQVAPEPTIWIGENPQLFISWDPVTKDVDGNAEVISSYRIAFLATTADMNAGASPLAIFTLPPESFQGVVGRTLIQALTDGPYRVQLQAVDRALNESRWNAPVISGVDRKPPGAPGALRVEFRGEFRVALPGGGGGA